MMTKDERTQAIKFQDAIGEIVDQYLKEGMDPGAIEAVLHDEGNSDLHARQKELDADPALKPAVSVVDSEPRWVVGKNGWDASDEATREDI